MGRWIGMAWVGLILASAPISEAASSRSEAGNSESQSSLSVLPGDAATARMSAELARQVSDPFPPPNDPGDLDQYTWGKLGQALAILYLDKGTAEANTLIREACVAFRTDDGSLKMPEGFHWQGNLLFRIYALFSSRSGFQPGKLEPEVEAAIAALFWDYASATSVVEEAKTTDYWKIWGSENHHLMRASTLWSAAAVLRDDPAFRNRRFADGELPEAHYQAWTKYFTAYLREHFGKGLWMESASPTYLKYSLQGLYNFNDFASDDALREAATASLDLQWTAWTLEQVGGMRGGAKARSYSGTSSTDANKDSSNGLAWYYFGLGPIRETRHPSFLCALTSGYRPPEELDALLDQSPPRADAEQFVSRTVGRARLGSGEEKVENVAEDHFYFLDPDAPGLFRTTFRTPEFVMGSFYLEALPHGLWSALVSQNHWNGLLLPGRPDAMIHIRTDGEGSDRSTYNGQRAVQNGGTMMIQGLARTSLGKYIWPLSVHIPAWMPREEEEGWMFLNLKTVFVAIRSTVGGWKEREPGVLTVENRAAPIVLQAAPSRRFSGGFAEFKQKVCEQVLTVSDDHVIFQSALDHCRLGMDLVYQELPTIDGQPLDVSAAAAWSGNFLEQAWGSTTALLSIPGKDPLTISAEAERIPRPETATW